jgi:AraC-like DNA-binding protein
MTINTNLFMNNNLIDSFHITTLNVGYAHHNADWNWCNVRSPFARLYYVTEGEAQIEFLSADKKSQNTVTLSPDHLYIIPPFSLHNEVCAGSFSHYYIHVYENQNPDNFLLEDFDFPTETEALPSDLALFKRLCILNPFLTLPASNPDYYDNQSSLIKSVSRGQQRSFSDIVESRGILYILMSRFFKTAHCKMIISDNRISQSVIYIRRNIDKNFNIASLASQACMSKDHYIRRFKEETDQTPIVFINNKKMEHAELLLITTEYPIKNIATLLGFEDYSYFNRVFFKHVGITPKKYRNNNC